MEHSEVTKGIFYGVSVGPGDPELITLKAVRILERCPVVAAPRTGNGEMLALDIARQAADLSGKVILPLRFTMHPQPEQRQAAHREAARAVLEHLSAGRDVAMLNLGDVSVYGTYPYVQELVKQAGYETRMIPGVPSFCAVAARLGRSLTEADRPLHLIPGCAGDDRELRGQLEMPGSKVLMKSGKQLPRVLAALERAELLERSALVCACGLPEESVCPSLKGSGLPENAGYFTTIVVK